MLNKEFSFYLFLISVNIIVAQELNLPKCARECLKPVVKLQKTNYDIYVNYEETCDKLEPAALCAQKCGQEDHTVFHQVTTNIRIHCVDFSEGE